MSSESPTSFDAVIIGTGQAGKPLAGALAEAGWSVAIVERDRVGGTCVISGCTPTKTMVASARVAHLAHRAPEYGVGRGELKIDLERVRDRKRTIVDEWSEGSRKGLEGHDTVELIFGEARFVDARTVEIRSEGEQARRISSEHIFINTGTRTRWPELDGLAEARTSAAGVVLDSTSIMELGEVPEHLVVLGGGFIGLEFGQMFRRFGAKVTILEAGSQLLSREDEDVAEALQEILEEEGIEVRLGQEATAVEVAGDGREVTVSTRDGADSGSHLLVAIGRIPNTEDLDAEAAGLELTDRGHIRVNERLETNVEGIWALGDVNGGPPFTHVAHDDFRVVRDNVLGSGGATREGRMVPYVLFTDPQLGRVGLSEGAARQDGVSYRLARLSMSRAARAMETDETRGFMKVLVDPDSGTILGATVLGVEGGEIMSILQMAMMGGVTADRIREGVFAHPTLAEALNNLFMTLE